MTAAWSLRPPGEAMPLLRATAQRALDLDPHLSDAHALLGVVAGMYDYDWQRAERHFTLALGASRVSPFARVFFAQYYLLPLGRTREAIGQMERALESDPLNVLFRSLYGICLHAAGETERTTVELAKALEIEGNHWTIHIVSSLNYAAAQRFDEAIDVAEKAFQVAPWQSLVIGTLAGLLTFTAETDRAEQLLQQLRNMPAHRAPFGMTLYHCIRSEPEAALDWLEKVIQQRDVWSARFPRLRISDGLRSNARWSAIMRTMNLPEAAW